MSKKKLTGTEVAKLFMSDCIPDGSDEDVSDDDCDVDPEWTLPESNVDESDNNERSDKENESSAANCQPDVGDQLSTLQDSGGHFLTRKTTNR